MTTRISALVLALALSITATGRTTIDYREILESAFDAVDWQFPDHYAFTEISTSDGTTIEARYDPRRPDGERWSLVAVDGRAATDEEIEDFAKRRHAYEVRLNHDDDGVLEELVRMDTVELAGETRTHWRLSFEPDVDAEDADERRIFRKMRGEALVAKAGNRIESITIRNHKAIRPAMMAKISRLQLDFGFTPVDDAVVLSDIDIAVAGSALVAIRFDETESIRYRDFDRVD